MVYFIPAEPVCDKREGLILKSCGSSESTAGSTLEPTNWDLVHNICQLFYYL